MRLLPLLLVLLFSGCNTENSGGMTRYYFIRHAEKDLSNPSEKDMDLNTAGKERTKKWAEALKDIPLDMIYVSQYKRTRQTAAPTAKAQDLDMKTYNTSELNDPDFQQKTKGKTVLVVGHSDINPDFANSILEEPFFKDMDEKEFGSLYILTISPQGKKTVQVLYIN